MIYNSSIKLVGLLFRVAFWLFTIATPLAGFWLASSLAAYSGSSMQLAALAGFALFPFVPLVWLGVSELRRKRRGVTAKHTLTFGDRLLWRTLLLNLLFLGGLLWLKPETSFLALSTRGDWMVEGLQSPMATLVRDTTDRVTSKIEWLYVRARENPYEKQLTENEPPPPPTPTPTGPPVRRWVAMQTPTPDGGGFATPEPVATPDLAAPGEAPAWPMPLTLEPIVSKIPPSVDTSPESVGRWLAGELGHDPFRLAKAIHDYIADRVAYDYDALAKFPDIPDEVANAQDVWRNRRGVCSGYSDLYRVMAKAAGLDAAYLVGEIRGIEGGVEPIKHAWNAVKVRDGWYLMDVTWDAGGSHGDNRFHKEYSTNYLFAPPEAFGLDHFPDDERWQLRANPLTRAEFVRQPLVRPEFLAKGLELLSPQRPQVDAEGSLNLRLRNPKSMSLIVTAQKKGAKGEEKRCLVTAAAVSVATCSFDSAGTWKVSIYASDQRYGSHPYVGGVEVNERG